MAGEASSARTAQAASGRAVTVLLILGLAFLLIGVGTTLFDLLFRPGGGANIGGGLLFALGLGMTLAALFARRAERVAPAEKPSR